MALNKRFMVAVAWHGLPFYAVAAIRAFAKNYPSHDVVVIGTGAIVPYRNLEQELGIRIHWIDSTQFYNWSAFVDVLPDVFVMTSWNHVAFMALARELKSKKPGAKVISMIDNYFHWRLKQIIGLCYYRVFYRRLFDYMWVPGSRSKLFMKLLGVCDTRIITGLYTADNTVYKRTSKLSERNGVLFVGQFIERKGLRLLINNKVKCPDFTAQFTLIGSGPLKRELQDNGFTCKDFMQAPQLSQEYNSAKAILLPSHIDHWGVVGHEAALCGCILIATRFCGFVDDLIDHKVNGYIMQEVTDEELTNALHWLGSLTSDEFRIASDHSLLKATQFSQNIWSQKLYATARHNE